LLIVRQDFPDNGNVLGASPVLLEVKLRIAFFIMLACTLSAPASAQAPSGCQSIVVRDARLRCYDRLFPPIEPRLDTLPDASGPYKADVSATAEATTLDYSWANVAGCKRMARAPEFKFSSVPAGAHSVSLGLTKDDRELGGQEVILTKSGVIPEGSIIMEGPCAPGNYRWTATIKSATGVILATVHADRWFPAN
jgi:hypothetical protein